MYDNPYYRMALEQARAGQASGMMQPAQPVVLTGMDTELDRAPRPARRSPVMQMAAARQNPVEEYTPTTGAEMEADSRSSIDDLMGKLQEQRAASRQQDRNQQWMSFFGKLASSNNPRLLGGLGEAAGALSETTGKQNAQNTVLDQAALADQIKYEQWKQEQAMKGEENASEAKLRDATAGYYKTREAAGASGGTATVKAQRYMDDMAALGTPVTFIDALAATSNAGLKNTVTNKSNLPTFIADAETGINNIDMMIGNDAKGIKEHPGLKGAVGPISSKLPTVSNDVADFETRAKQATGGAFLDAYNTLRGGGAITEVEGEKATAARSRMLLATSEDAFREAAKEYRSYIVKGIERAKEKAGVANAALSEDTNPKNELDALLAEKARRAKK